MNTFDKIYEVVKKIPKGQVATYGQVAALAGNRHWSRVVGYALHANPAFVPLIVLVLSLAIFGLLLGTKFFSAFTLTLILQQVAIVGIVGAAVPAVGRDQLDECREQARLDHCRRSRIVSLIAERRSRFDHAVRTTGHCVDDP